MAFQVTYRCARCGDDLGAIEVTDLGSAEPTYIPGRACPCPGPRCPCCRARLLEERCPTVGCPVYDVLIPAPDIS